MKDNKSRFLFFRVTPEERKALEDLAVLEQRGLSNIVRLLVREGLQKRIAERWATSKSSNGDLPV